VDVTQKRGCVTSYRVLVSFGHHVFSRAAPALPDAGLTLVGPLNDRRLFCEDRWRRSLEIRKLIKSAVGGRAYFPNSRHPRAGRNFFF